MPGSPGSSVSPAVPYAATATACASWSIPWRALPATPAGTGRARAPRCRPCSRTGPKPLPSRCAPRSAGSPAWRRPVGSRLRESAPRAIRMPPATTWSPPSRPVSASWRRVLSRPGHPAGVARARWISNRPSSRAWRAEAGPGTVGAGQASTTGEALSLMLSTAQNQLLPAWWTLKPTFTELASVGTGKEQVTSRFCWSRPLLVFPDVALE